MAFTDNQLRDKMEPEVQGMPLQLACPISLAISVKRIADFICGSDGNPNRMDIVQYIEREFGGRSQ